MVRLNGQKRIGIIASVVWILGAGIFTYRAVKDYEAKKYAVLCDEVWKNYLGENGPVLLENYLLENGPEVWEDYLREDRHGPWDEYRDLTDGNGELCPECQVLVEDYATIIPRRALKVSASVALIPVPVGWGLAYLILFLVNWVKRGFMRPL